MMQSSENEQVSSENQNKECKYTPGQPLTFVQVRFPGNAKAFPFLVGNRAFAYGQRVLAMSDRGMAVGYINSFPYTLPFEESMLPIRTISKIATEKDMDQQENCKDDEKRAEDICLKYIEQYKLNMNLTHVEFIQFGKKAVFYFNAPERVDFRELVKSLVSELKMRIELRQISIRDRTAALGGIGACGRQICCSSFLRNYGNSSIKMAKNQNLALIPSKINGVCGQIKCCMRYEDDVYKCKRKKLPKENSFIKALNGDRGKVLKLNLLKEEFTMLTDAGQKRRYSLKLFSKDSHLENDWVFPERFEHIVDETSTIIEQLQDQKEEKEEKQETAPINKQKDSKPEQRNRRSRNNRNRRKKTK